MPAFENVFNEDERKAIVDYLRATWTFGDYVPVLPDDLRTPEGEGP